MPGSAGTAAHTGHEKVATSRSGSNACHDHAAREDPERAIGPQAAFARERLAVIRRRSATGEHGFSFAIEFTIMLTRASGPIATTKG